MELSTNLGNLNRPEKCDGVASCDYKCETYESLENLWIRLHVFLAVGKCNRRSLGKELAVSQPNDIKQRRQHDQLA